MTSKLFVVLPLLILGSFCQISVITVKNSSTGTTTQPANSPKPAVNNADNFTSPDDSPNFVPCNGKDSCGDAKSFSSASQFKTFINQNSGTATNAAAASAPASSNLRSFTPQSSTPQPVPQQTAKIDFSGTNNQEENVDEADLLKSDGTYIYTISNKILSIVLAYPASNAKVVSQVTLENSPSAIFLHGNFLAVFGTQAGFTYKNEKYSNYFTFIKIYNIANKASPFLVRTYEFMGRYVDARKLSSGFVYLISNFVYTRSLIPWCDWGSGKVDLEYGSIYKYPGTYVSLKGINILSFNLGNPVNGGHKIISICAEAASIVYMSQNNIYLTSKVIESGQDHTVIRKIFVRNLNIVPFGDAKVRGSIRSQFSLNEYGPYLRVATSNLQGSDQWNNVYILNYYCQSYGVLTRIAPGEKIFSARYFGKRLYLITFNQVDPFYVIQFSSFKAPTILGEFKMTGYSSYLHPIDENTILGFGRDATVGGVPRGLRVAVFDVTNPQNPRMQANVTFSERYPNSTALWNHKAFLYSREKNLLVLPGNWNKTTRFNGVFAFTVTKTSVELSGTIDHLLNENNNFDVRSVQRSLYIENNLYTKSKCLLRINRIDANLTAVSNIGLPCGQNVQTGALTVPN